MRLNIADCLTYLRTACADLGLPQTVEDAAREVFLFSYERSSESNLKLANRVIGSILYACVQLEVAVDVLGVCAAADLPENKVRALVDHLGLWVDEAKRINPQLLVERRDATLEELLEYYGRRLGWDLTTRDRCVAIAATPVVQTMRPSLGSQAGISKRSVATGILSVVVRLFQLDTDLATISEVSGVAMASTRQVYLTLWNTKETWMDPSWNAPGAGDCDSVLGRPGKRSGGAAESASSKRRKQDPDYNKTWLAAKRVKKGEQAVVRWCEQLQVSGAVQAAAKRVWRFAHQYGKDANTLLENTRALAAIVHACETEGAAIDERKVCEAAQVAPKQLQLRLARIRLWVGEAEQINKELLTDPAEPPLLDLAQHFCTRLEVTLSAAEIVLELAGSQKVAGLMTQRSHRSIAAGIIKLVLKLANTPVLQRRMTEVTGMAESLVLEASRILWSAREVLFDTASLETETPRVHAGAEST